MTTTAPRGAAESNLEAAALPIGLAFVAGYVDTVGFVTLFGLFTAHVTGNFVLIGATLARSSDNVTLKLVIFPAFVVAVAVTRFVVLWMERHGRQSLRPLLLLQLLLMLGFAWLGWRTAPDMGSDAAPVLWAGILGGAAMGVQNAAARLLLPAAAPSTVMTGNVTQLAIDCVDLALRKGDEATGRRAKRYLSSIVSFTIGAMGGGFGAVFAGFGSLLVPISVIAWLAATQGPTREPA